MRKLRSFRGQAVLASLLLLVILGGMAAVAIWRVQSDRDVRRTLESRATAVAALNDARAEFFLDLNLLTAAALGGDPVPFVEEYRLRRPLAAGSIAEAQAELATLNEPETIAALGTIGDEIEALLQEVDTGVENALNLDLDQETMIRLAMDYERTLWPRYESIMEGIEQLAIEQQAELAADHAAANDASNTSLSLLVGLGALAFLVASAILITFVLTLLGSLTSLRASARAITSGNLEARADVSGPEETASLARDFNEMTETLVERSAQLQESEGRFRNVLEVSRDLIYKLNLQTSTFDYASPSSLRLTGFTFEELTEMGLQGADARVHPEDRKRYKVSPSKLPSPTSKHSPASIIEYRWKCKDGEYRWFADNRALVRDEHGKPLATVGTVRDITERKQAEAALRESEERFRSLSASAPIGIFLTDAEGNVIYTNEFLQEVSGLPFDESVGAQWTKIVHPDDREALLQGQAKAVTEGGEFTYEFRIVTPQEESRWVHVHTVPTLSEESEQSGRVGTIEDITERKQAEAALRESEEKFRTLSASAPIGIFQTDMQARFTYVNEHLLGIHGLRLEELLGEAWTKRIHPDDYRAIAEEALKAGKKKRAFSGEYRILRPQGEIRWIRVVSSPVLSRDGDLVSYVGAAEDITERKQAEAALRESEERFRSLSAAAPIGIFLTDAKGNTVYANQRLLSLAGRSYEEGLGLKWTQFIHPEDRDAVFAEIARAAAENREFSQEYRLLTKAGEEIWVHGTATTIRTPEGTITGHIGTIEDITERRKADAALRESEQKFRTLSASAAIGIFQTDAQGRLTYANEHLLGIHGLPVEELLGEIWSKRIHPDDRRAAVEEGLKAAGERRTFSREYRILRPQGETRWIRVVSSPVLSRDGRPVSFVGAAEDITERRQAEEALRESEERFRTLSASAPIGIFQTDMNGRFTYANDHLLAIHGMPFEELLGEVWTKRIHPDDHRATADAALKAGKALRTFSREYRIVRPQGEIRWIRAVSSPVLSRDGRPVSFVGAAEDITERRQAEAALRESEEKFRSLSAAAPVGIFLIDDKGEIVYTNERLQGISGAPSPGEQRSELAANVHPDDRERITAGWLKAEAEHAELSQEFRVLTPQGETRWVRIHACPILSADGRPSSVVGTVEDITEQIQAAEAMTSRLRMESAVARASNQLTGPEDTDAALNLALSILGEGFGAERGAIFLARGKGRADGVAEWHAPGAAEVEFQQDIDLAQFPWLIEKMLRAEPIIIPDVSAMPPEAAAEKEAWQAIGNRSMVITSLMSRGRSIGCVFFDNTDRTRDWREEDVSLLRLASESIASFVERQRSAKERRDAYERIVLLLATAAEARDPYTEHHLHRIRGYAEAIATEMGLPPDEVKEIGLCSLLHDLGKLRVPDSILMKPSTLSEDEWVVMKKHPVWGEELLSTHQWMKTARQIARWHHERWDGSGYPDGLRGEQIPVSAAIVTVADGLDAMTSERPYKGAWPPQKAIQEIRAQKGKQYSPKVVEALNRALRKGAIKRVAVESLRISELSRAA